MPPDLFEEICRVRRENRAAALATVVGTRGSTPGKLAQRMLVLGDARSIGTVGGGCVEAEVIRAALDVIDTGRTRKMSFTLNGEEAERSGLACGGVIEIMIEALNDPRLFVIGCGHVGQKIARLAKTCGFHVTAVDDRPDFASPQVLPGIDEIVLEELGRLRERLEIGPNSFVISVTRGHDHDYEVVKWALETPARFIGLIGSRSKRVQFLRDLEAEGKDAAALARIRCPVGLEIGAKSPDEIAVSVVAELIAVLRLSPGLPRGT